MKIALTGASGFVGSALQEIYKDPVLISREDAEDEILRKLEDVDVVINLAGAPIIKRWNESYKKLLVNSRIDTTRKLVSAINKSSVKHFISTSAIGIYPNDVVCDESSPLVVTDFLSRLAREWEQEALFCEKPTTILRFGMILGKDAGALGLMMRPFKLGVGGIIADGKMKMSWIDIADLVRIYPFVIEKKLTGVINAVSPKPISNYTFTKAFGRAIHRPTIIPVPEFVLHLLYGEAASVLTGSKEVYPNVLEKNGFVFEYPDIDASLKHLLQ